jgi:hypothetical protein
MNEAKTVKPRGGGSSTARIDVGPVSGILRVNVRHKNVAFENVRANSQEGH